MPALSLLPDALSSVIFEDQSIANQWQGNITLDY